MIIINFDEVINKALGTSQMNTFWSMMFSIINISQKSKRIFWLKNDYLEPNGKTLVENTIINLVGRSNVSNLSINDLKSKTKLANLTNTFVNIRNYSDFIQESRRAEDTISNLMNGLPASYKLRGNKHYQLAYNGTLIFGSNNLTSKVLFKKDSELNKYVVPLTFNYKNMGPKLLPNLKTLKSANFKEALLIKVLNSGSEA